jgi:hypothetical protein
MPNIIIPAIKLIILFLVVRKLITCLLFALEINANMNNGIPIPIPNTTKLRKFVKKLTVEVLTANKMTSDAGLHGSTIAPKKNPNINDVRNGFFVTGACIFGNNEPMSKLKINKMLTTPNIPNATGLTIPIALVSDSCSSRVNIKPKTVMEIMTPVRVTAPSKIMSFLELFSSVFPDN